MPVLLCRSESYALKDSEGELLAVFERRILRIIYGPVCEDGEWITMNGTNCINIQALFEIFELDVCNGLDMCGGWKRMSRPENVSHKPEWISNERKTSLNGVTLYHVMLIKRNMTATISPVYHTFTKHLSQSHIKVACHSFTKF
uniref:Uncharacterized protein n=1 Tax=Megaselia scalaris TaxID=36166 RepID=T1GII1_MEGSC